jgi:hypothetical protein
VIYHLPPASPVAIHSKDLKLSRTVFRSGSAGLLLTKVTGLTLIPRLPNKISPIALAWIIHEGLEKEENKKPETE